MLSFTSIQKIRTIPLQAYLSQKEIDIYKKLLLTKKNDWLAGKFAAKKAIRFYFLKKYQTGFSLKNIEIISGKFQKPDYKILKPSPWGNKILKKIKHNTNICISHSTGAAIAAIASTLKDGLTGVDIEKIRNFTPAVLNSFLAKEEKTAFNRQSDRDKPKLATLLWCVKEAYLKAVGKGLLCHPKFIEARLNIKKNIYEIYDNGRKISTNIQWRVFKKDYIIVEVNVMNTAQQATRNYAN